MTLALVSTSDAAFVRAAAVPGIRSLGWADSPPDGLTEEDLDRISTAVAAGRATSP